MSATATARALTPRQIAAAIRTAYPGAAGVALEAADALDAQAHRIEVLERKITDAALDAARAALAAKEA
jgi:hypothetical protein